MLGGNDDHHNDNPPGASHPGQGGSGDKKAQQQSGDYSELNEKRLHNSPVGDHDEEGLLQKPSSATKPLNEQTRELTGSGAAKEKANGAGASGPSPSHRTKASAALRPHRNDVILGRGKPYQSFPGNQRMLQIVAGYKNEFFSRSRETKKKFVDTVLDAVLEDGTRFLRRIEEQDGTERWEEVTRAVSAEKVWHALRCKSRSSEKTAKRKRSPMEEAFTNSALEQQRKNNNEQETPLSTISIPTSSLLTTSTTTATSARGHQDSNIRLPPNSSLAWQPASEGGRAPPPAGGAAMTAAFPGMLASTAPPTLANLLRLQLPNAALASILAANGMGIAGVPGRAFPVGGGAVLLLPGGFPSALATASQQQQQEARFLSNLVASGVLPWGQTNPGMLLHSSSLLPPPLTGSATSSLLHMGRRAGQEPAPAAFQSAPFSFFPSPAALASLALQLPATAVTAASTSSSSGAGVVEPPSSSWTRTASSTTTTSSVVHQPSYYATLPLSMVQQQQSSLQPNQNELVLQLLNSLANNNNRSSSSTQEQDEMAPRPPPGASSS